MVWPATKANSRRGQDPARRGYKSCCFVQAIENRSYFLVYQKISSFQTPLQKTWLPFPANWFFRLCRFTNVLYNTLSFMLNIFQKSFKTFGAECNDQSKNARTNYRYYIHVCNKHIYILRNLTIYLVLLQKPLINAKQKNWNLAWALNPRVFSIGCPRASVYIVHWISNRTQLYFRFVPNVLPSLILYKVLCLQFSRVEESLWPSACNPHVQLRNLFSSSNL